MNVWIYAFHGLFWIPFVVRKLRGDVPAVRTVARARREAGAAREAPRAKLLVVAHTLGFVILYAGIGQEVFSPAPEPFLLPGHLFAGGFVIAIGAAVAAWALAVLDSWRLLARLDADARLCTRGPYRWMRHPIYLACDLFAIGTFVAIPTPTILGGTVVMLVAADLRARAEETLCAEAFGEEYTRWSASTRRYVPGVY